MRDAASASGDARIDSEAEIVALLKPLAASLPGAFGLADDCAALAPSPGTEFVLKTDAVAEGVHFRPTDAAADIGWKALAVNVSDLAGKGARPRAYLMSLAFPEAPTRSWMAGFVAGLAEAQDAFGIALAGGDTDRRPGPSSITIAAIGEVEAGRMVRRGSARPGDRLYVSGTLGDAALGLAVGSDASLAARWALSTDQAAFLKRRYLRPAPRLALRAALLDCATAAMDLSDGLVKDLGRMASASGTGAEIAAHRLPLSQAARSVAARSDAALKAALSGGDDYEILAAVAPGTVAAFEAAAAAAGVAVAAIGTMTAGAAVVVVDAAGREIDVARGGYDHFSLL